MSDKIQSAEEFGKALHAAPNYATEYEMIEARDAAIRADERRKVIEECAKVCAAEQDAMHHNAATRTDEAASWTMAMAACRNCKNAIRALLHAERCHAPAPARDGGEVKSKGMQRGPGTLRCYHGVGAVQVEVDGMIEHRCKACGSPVAPGAQEESRG